MLVKMYPEQVAKSWDILSYGIQQTLPPITYQSPKRMEKILESLLSEELVLWLGVDDDNKVQGLIVTSIVYEKNSDVKDLLIYSLYGFNNIPYRMIIEGMDTLKVYANSIGCKRITAYSNVKSIIKLMKKFGSAEYTYLSIPANGEDYEN